MFRQLFRPIRPALVAGCLAPLPVAYCQPNQQRKTSQSSDPAPRRTAVVHCWSFSKPTRPSTRRVVFVAAPSGAGKTTLAEGLKASHGFVHFEVDGWISGSSAFEPSKGNLEEGNRLREARSPEFVKMVTAFQVSVKKMIDGEPDFHTPAVDEFYARLGADINKALAESPDRGMVISFIVCTKRQRDLVRQHVPDVEFVLLEPDASLTKQRIMRRFEQQAENNGLTPQGLADQMGQRYKMKLTPEWIVDKLASMSAAEPAADGEPRTHTIAVGAMTEKEVLRRAEELLGL